jgi:hypothetical protein
MIRYTLTDRALDARERAVFSDDLDHWGLDERALLALDGLLQTGTPDVLPRILRGYRGDRLVFVAHPLICRRTMRSFFPGRLGAAMDVVPAPTICWTRNDPAVDLCGSPGFTATGEDRNELVRGALRHLCRGHVAVNVVEEEASGALDPCLETPMADIGRFRPGEGDVERLFAARKHLKRKVARFRNQGGRVEVVEGELSEPWRQAVLRCVTGAADNGLLRIPYQDNYVPMVEWATLGRVPGLLHFFAYVGENIVGYHAFLETGRTLACLSGGFDRHLRTFHAYENVLLEAMRYGETRGLAVHFGPVTNPSKAAVMPRAARMVVRLYSRLAFVRVGMSRMIRVSAMRAEVFEPFRGLGLTGGRLIEEEAGEPHVVAS